MGTIADKLQLLRENKEDIRAAIVEKGQSVPATTPLSAYGDKIRAIQTGADAETVTVSLRSEPKYGKVDYYYLVNGQLESLPYSDINNNVVSKSVVLQLPALIVATKVSVNTLFTTSPNVTKLDISDLNMALFTIEKTDSGETYIRAWG